MSIEGIYCEAVSPSLFLFVVIPNERGNEGTLFVFPGETKRRFHARLPPRGISFVPPHHYACGTRLPPSTVALGKSLCFPVILFL
jgi:hypothetical protein